MMPTYPSGLATYDPRYRRNWDQGVMFPLRDPWGELSMLPSGINRLGQTNEATQPLAPLMSADLIETATDFNIHVDIPGVSSASTSSVFSFKLTLLNSFFSRLRILI